MDKLEGEFTLSHGKNVIIVEYKVVKLEEGYDNGYAVLATRKMAAKAGFRLTDEVMIATAASELATNIIRYAKQGEIFISIIRDLNCGKTGIELYAIDFGPGIQDLELAMKEEYSSLPDSLGLGIPSVKRIMEDFYIESLLGKGTRVLTRKWRN